MKYIVILLLIGFSHIILVSTQFFRKSSTSTGKRGSKVILRCEANGKLLTSITWLHNGLPIDENNNRLSILEREYLNNTIGEIHIHNLQLEDKGEYICKAHNKDGEITNKVHLVVQDVPSAPVVTINNAWTHSLSLKWTEINAEPSINYYIVQYYHNSTATSYGTYTSYASPLNEYTSKVSSAIIDNLLPGSVYFVRVLGVNSLGRGKPSEWVVGKLSEQPPGPVMDVNVETVGMKKIRVTWRSPSQWNGVGRGFKVGCKKIDENSNVLHENLITDIENDPEYKIIRVDYNNNANHLEKISYLLNDLERATSYLIVIRAFNNAGDGPLSQPIIGYTSNHDPPPAPSIYIANKKETNVLIKWDQRKQQEQASNQSITHYILYYKAENSPLLEIAFPATDVNQYQLNNLQKGTWYEIYMKSMSKYGSSEPSKVVKVRTAREYAINSKRIVRKVPNFASLLTIALSIGSLLILCAAACGYMYIKHEEKKINTRTPNSVSEEAVLTLRYSDYSDRCRPLLARPPVPTMLWAVQDDRSYPPPLPSHPPPLLPTNTQQSVNISRVSIGGMPNLSPIQEIPSSTGMPSCSEGSPIKHTSPKITVNPGASNVFCKADVHRDEGEDEHIYDFFTSQV